MSCLAWLNNKDGHSSSFVEIINGKNWPDWASRKRIFLILVLDTLGVVDWGHMNQIFIMILYSVLSLLALPFSNQWLVECTFSEMNLIKHKLCCRMKDIHLDNILCIWARQRHEICCRHFRLAKTIHTYSDLENVNGSIKRITACGTLLGQSN